MSVFPTTNHHGPVPTTTHYKRLENVSFGMVSSSMVAINNDDYVTIYHDSTLPIWIYKAALDRYIPVVVGLRFGYVYSAQYDQQTRLLFVTRNDDLLAMNIDDPSKPVIKVQLPLKTIYGDQMVLVNDDIHLFGRYKGSRGYSEILQHAVICRKSLTFKKDSECIDATFHSTDTAIYLKTRKSIAIFGVNSNGRKHVIEYILATNQCTPSLWMLPSSIIGSSSGICCTKRGDRILIFGGEIQHKHYSSGVIDSRSITIVDLKRRILVESAVECPSRSRFQALLLSDPHREEMLVFGFVRKAFKYQSMRHVQQLPHYLIQFIAKWVTMEFVHLDAGSYAAEGGHFMINLDDIMNSVEHLMHWTRNHQTNVLADSMSNVTLY